MKTFRASGVANEDLNPVKSFISAASASKPDRDNTTNLNDTTTTLNNKLSRMKPIAEYGAS